MNLCNVCTDQVDPITMDPLVEPTIRIDAGDGLKHCFNEDSFRAYLLAQLRARDLPIRLSCFVFCLGRFLNKIRVQYQLNKIRRSFRKDTKQLRIRDPMDRHHIPVLELTPIFDRLGIPWDNFNR